MTVLIAVALPDDEHVARVASILDERGLTTLSFSPVSTQEVGPPKVNWSGAPVHWTLPRLDGGGPVTVDPSTAVFWFRNKHTVEAIRTAADQQEFFELHTRMHFVTGFVQSQGLRAINMGPHINRFAFKLHQLAVAERYGLTPPRSLISSDRAAILAFVRQAPSIVKPLHLANIGPPSAEEGPPMILMTSRITAEQVEAAGDLEFSSAPLILQEEIEKAFELRVVVFGDDALAYKIDSQRHEISQVDWRWGEQLGLTQPYDLDPQIVGQLIAFCRGEGLDTGVFDLIVTPDGAVRFLECNPSGQWGMLEDPTRQEISTVFARNIAGLALGGPRVAAA